MNNMYMMIFSRIRTKRGAHPLSILLTAVLGLCAHDIGYADPCTPPGAPSLEIEMLSGFGPPSASCGAFNFMDDQDPPESQDQQTIREFNASRDAFFTQVEAAGITQIAGQDIASLEAQMQAGKTSTKPQLCTELNEGGMAAFRNSALWWRSTDQKTAKVTYGVKINDPIWKITAKEVQPVLACHESLGSIGIYDDDYNCCASLWLLSKPAGYIAVLRPSELAEIKNYTQTLCQYHLPAPTPQNQVQLLGKVYIAPAALQGAQQSPATGPKKTAGGGSSTGVGGGGDERDAQTKMIKVVAAAAKMASFNTDESQQPKSELSKWEAVRPQVLQDLEMEMRSEVSNLDENFQPYPGEAPPPDIFCMGYLSSVYCDQK